MSHSNNVLGLWGIIDGEQDLEHKLMFLHHLLSWIMTVWQNRFCLVDECQDYLVKFGIIMSEIGKMSNIQWKTLPNKNIAMLNRQSLLEKIKTSYKKLDANELKLETFELKPYMTKMHLTKARLNFRIRRFMTRTVKMNFSSD